MNQVKAKDCVAGQVYYLTGLFWYCQKNLINTPVVLKEVVIDRWIERLPEGFSRRKQEKLWLFESLDQKYLCALRQLETVFVKPLIPETKEIPVEEQTKTGALYVPDGIPGGNTLPAAVPLPESNLEEQLTQLELLHKLLNNSKEEE